MTETFTLEKTNKTAGGTYTNIVEFAIDAARGTAIIAQACSWKRVVNGEQDNGSDLFGQKTVSIATARKEYAQHVRNLGYVRTDANYGIVRA